jgi:hypothetical protein
MSFLRRLTRDVQSFGRAEQTRAQQIPGVTRQLTGTMGRTGGTVQRADPR